MWRIQGRNYQNSLSMNTKHKHVTLSIWSRWSDRCCIYYSEGNSTSWVSPTLDLRRPAEFWNFPPQYIVKAQYVFRQWHIPWGQTPDEMFNLMETSGLLGLDLWDIEEADKEDTATRFSKGSQYLRMVYFIAITLRESQLRDWPLNHLPVLEEEEWLHYRMV